MSTDAPPAALADKEVALDTARASEREKSRQLAQSYFTAAQTKRFSGRMGRRFESLELLKKAAATYDALAELTKEKQLELRNEAIACLALVDLKKGEEWELQPDWRGDGPFFDPNLEYYAVTSDWPSVIELVEQSLATDPNNYYKLHHLGAVLYRAGRFEEATKQLAEADAAFKDMKYPEATPILTWFFLAMAHQQLGHANEARQWLKKASACIEEAEIASPEYGSAKQPCSWGRRLRLQLLRREAEEMMNH